MVEVIKHPFFSDVLIDKLISKELVPPFKPEMGRDGDMELNNFDPNLTKLDAVESVIDEE